jgi:MATE family multidrug resistance protein
MFLNVAAFNLFLLMFQSYGIAESASAAIVFNWDIMSFVPMMGLNTAIISLVGRSIGAGNTSQLYEVVRVGFYIGLGFSAVLAVTFFTFREPMIGVFLGDDTPVYFLELASFMMIGLSTYVMADATILIAGGVLRGAGDTRWLMWVSILLHWIMLIVEYFVIEVWGLGPRVAWVVFVIMILATAVTYLIRLMGPKWRSEEAFQRVMAEQF